MIMGACPYCDAGMMNPIADLPLPKFQKLITECCGKTIWLRHSRVDPQAFTDEDFKNKFIVNEETREISKKI